MADISPRGSRRSTYRNFSISGKMHQFSKSVFLFSNVDQAIAFVVREITVQVADLRKISHR